MNRSKSSYLPATLFGLALTGAAFGFGAVTAQAAEHAAPTGIFVTTAPAGDLYGSMYADVSNAGASRR